jgi:hypothetical protein
MNAEAQKLIRLLEQECKSLRRMIAADVREEDYKLADAHDGALQRALAKLRLVRNLEDVNADRKEFLRTLVGRYSAIQENNGYYGGYMKRNEEELAKLEQQGPVPVPESNLLAAQLQLVVVGTVRGINIVLSVSKRLSLRIRQQKKCVTLFIPHQAHLRNKGVIGKLAMMRLATMGFVEASEHRLEMKFTNSDATHARIMTVLSRIVFDVFRDNDFVDRSHIEVVDW